MSVDFFEISSKNRLQDLFGSLRTPFTGGADSADGTPEGADGTG